MVLKIISDQPVPKWMQEILEELEYLQKYHVEGALLATKTDYEKDGAASIASYTSGLSLADRMQLIGHLQYDIACKAAKQEIGGYLDIEEDEPDKPE